jgi:hypothetical protein
MTKESKSWLKTKLLFPKTAQNNFTQTLKSLQNTNLWVLDLDVQAKRSLVNDQKSVVLSPTTIAE